MILYNHQIIACLFLDEQECFILRMNNKKEKPLILKDYNRRVKRKEKYYFYERDKGRIIRFDDSYYKDQNADIIETLNNIYLHKALLNALKELNSLETQIINECFFDEKRTFTDLSKIHNISRQAYVKRLNKILIKLRGLIVNSDELLEF